ncbi:MAG: hypothetical protein M5U22_00545 [Thermoleophilia bacterium]|nr:hypothetical protein [Thermoleophilia bacterium]
MIFSTIAKGSEWRRTVCFLALRKLSTRGSAPPLVAVPPAVFLLAADPPPTTMPRLSAVFPPLSDWRRVREFNPATEI